MGGGHHHSEFKIPDWRMYKVENCKELLEVEKSLNRIGLKDPWLRYVDWFLLKTRGAWTVFCHLHRNEVWRYDLKIQKYTKNQKLMKSLFRGLPLGLGLTVATIALEKAFKVDYHDPRGIHGGHGHH